MTRKVPPFYLPFTLAILTLASHLVSADQRWSDGGRYDLTLSMPGLAILKVTPPDLRSWDEVYPLEGIVTVDRYPDYATANLKNILNVPCLVTMRKTIKQNGGFLMIEFTGRFDSEIFVPCSFMPDSEKRLSEMKVDVLHFEQTLFERVDEKTLNMKRLFVETWQKPHHFAMKDLEQTDFVTKQIPITEMIPPYERYFETTLIQQPHLEPEGHRETSLH